MRVLWSSWVSGGVRGVLGVVVTAMVVESVVGCSAPDEESSQPPRRDAGPATSAPVPPTAVPPTAVPPTAVVPTHAPLRPEPQAPARDRLRGVDVSHHQGSIDWARVADDGIGFAYLKATEGSTFTDPAFADNVAGARAAGLRVGGYHYFTLCSSPEPQAEHFVATWGSVDLGRRALPPVVDLELIGNCDPPPSSAAMLTAARAYVSRVEDATGRRVVVYVHPDFETTYPGLVDALDRRLWVRRTGDRPPSGDWWLWQRSDHAQVDGISTPVDLDEMRPAPG